MADPLWLIAGKLLAVIALVALNGFFVAAEFAIVKVRTTQVVARGKSGDARAAMATHVKDHLDAYLSACQLGITMASLALGWIGEPAVADLLEPVFLRAGLEDGVVLHTVSFAIAFGFITFLHIVFGELAPKSIAIRNAENTTLALSRPLHLFYRVFRPAIDLLNGFANWTLHLAGFQPASGTEQAHSRAELREILSRTSRAPATPEASGSPRVLLNLFDLAERKAGDIMTPVTRLVFLDAGKPLADNIHIAEDSGFSRFPLIEGTPDHVLGMVHYKDIANILRKDRPEQTLVDIRRELPNVPEAQSAEAVLTDMLRRGHHMSLVVDEHGRTVGIVTMEDIFEEVFGSIRDEFDEPEVAYKTLTEGIYLVEGTMKVRDLELLLGRDLRRPGVTTVGGLVIDVMGRIPLAGEILKWDGLEFTVREVGRRRVKSVEVRAKPLPAAEVPPAEGDVV